MPDDFALTAVAPEGLLALVAMALLLLGAFRGNAATGAVTWAGVAALAVCFAVLGAMAGRGGEAAAAFSGMFVVDSFALVLKMALALGLMAALALSLSPMRSDPGAARFEYPVLTLLAGVGMMGMVSAHNFLALYVAMEMQALALYVLVASGTGRARAAEAGMKYFLLGALASALMLFGVALLYGATGSLDYGAVAGALAGAEGRAGPVAGVALALILAALAFKLSATPFHMWTPDVYSGAPTRITALLAIVPKLAAVGVASRLLLGPLEPLAAQWGPIVAALAVASMGWGALAGVVQGDLKRLMAYSAIGNIGTVLLGLVAGGQAGVGAAVSYLMVYVLMTAGVFAIIASMRRDGRAVTAIEDLAGASRHTPARAAAMAVLMLSIAGIPPLAGFFAKLFVFKALIDAGMVALAAYGIATTVVAAFYYLRVVKVMYFDAPAEPFDADPAPERAAVLGVSIAGALGLVLVPGAFLALATAAAASLF